MDIVVGDGRFSCDSFHVWLSVCPDWCGRKRTLNRVIIPVQSIIIENRRGVSFVCFFEQVRLYYFIGFSFVFLFFFCFVVVFFCFRLHTFVLLTGGNRNIQQWCVCVCVWEREVCYDDIVGETWTVHWKWFFFQRKVNDKGAREIGLRGRDKQLNTKEKKVAFPEAIQRSLSTIKWRESGRRNWHVEANKKRSWIHLWRRQQQSWKQAVKRECRLRRTTGRCSQLFCRRLVYESNQAAAPRQKWLHKPPPRPDYWTSDWTSLAV